MNHSAQEDHHSIKNNKPKLYLVPTPVGNLEDMTLRAIRILKEVDMILAEDTRTSSILLKHFDIKTPLLSHHKFNEHQTVDNVVQQLLSGQTIALISDAGTPAISDPGFLLVRKCIENDIEIECLPGATAFVPALVVSGLPADRFCFEGFLPIKKGRQNRLKELASENRTMIFYESPFRVIKLIEELAQIMPERKVVLAREITKRFEEYIRGYPNELLEILKSKGTKGEYIVLVAPEEKK